MTTANRITILRILLVPFFVVELLYYVNRGEEWFRYIAIIAFAFASLTDAVDGFIAKRFNQRSELGAILDPLADKLLLVSGIVLLSLDNQPYLRGIPIWLTATIISRDVILLLGLVIIHFVSGKVIVKPRSVGKVATVLQMTVVLWILLKLPDFWLSLWIYGAGICTGLSGLLYLSDGIKQLSASPSSSALPTQDSKKGDAPKDSTAP